MGHGEAVMDSRGMAGSGRSGLGKAVVDRKGDPFRGEYGQVRSGLLRTGGQRERSRFVIGERFPNLLYAAGN